MDSSITLSFNNFLTLKKIKIYTDGGSRGNPGKAACAFVVKDEEGNIIYKEGKYLGETTNNQAEYNGLLEGLKYALKNEYKDVEIYMDSELVVKQIKGEYKVKDPGLKDMKAQVDLLFPLLGMYSINHVFRESNKEADKLLNEVLDNN